MRGAPERRSRSGLVLPTLVAVGAIATFIGLGTWQVQRKAWKEGLIESLEQRLSAAPADLPPRERWAKLDAATDEFRHVKFFAAFVPGAEALVYTSGSALRRDVSGPGYWAFAPAQLATGGIVVVNRGFVPEGRQDPATRAVATAAGRADFVGAMRWQSLAVCFLQRMIPPATSGSRATPPGLQLRLNWKARSRPASCRARVR